MKFARLLLSFCCVALFATSAHALTGSGTPEDPYILKGANYYPDAGPIGHGIHAETYDFIEREMGGRIKFERYFAGSLHSLADGFKALRSGLSDFAQAYPFNNTKAFRYTTADGLPWLYKSVAHATASAQEMYPKWYKKEFERQGLYLGMVPYFDYQILVSKKPVRTMEDLKGLKIMGHGVHLRSTLKSLGATPVFVTPPEIFIALQRGVIDGVLWSAGCTVPWRYDEVAKYATTTGMGVCGIFFGLNKASFDALPKDIQKDLYSVMQRAGNHMSELYTDLEKTGYEDMKAAGMEVITLSDDEMARWRAKGDVVWADYAKELEENGLSAQEFLKDLREIADKFNAMSIPELRKYTEENVVPGCIDGF